jgi:phosphohistidine phosphatase
MPEAGSTLRCDDVDRMARRLLLIRHAKSSWDEPSLPDRNRPLAKRGRKAAERIGVHLRREGVRPDVVLCSPSTRTRETLELLRFRRADISFPSELYGASAHELLENVSAVGDDAELVAVIGHNPGMQDLAVQLAGNDAVAGAVRLRERFPTCAVATFDIEGTWRDLTPERSRLASFVVPRDLP